MDIRRTRKIKKGRSGKGPVIYWMNRDQRTADNWALLYSQSVAAEKKKELAVLFCLTDEYLVAQHKHFMFMLEGLKEVEKELSRKKIPLYLVEGDPNKAIISFLKEHDIDSVITDFNPLKIKKKWIEGLIKNCPVPVYEVDAHNRGCCLSPCSYKVKF